MRDLDGDLVNAIRDDALRGILAVKARPPRGASDVDRQAWSMDRAAAVAGLDNAIMATRPFGPADPPAVRMSLNWLFGLSAALAEHWRIRPEDRKTLAGYAAEHDADWEGAKVILLMQAVPMVQASRQEPTTVRIGRRWVTDADGRRREVDPTTLDHFTYLRWFVGRSLRTARALLREWAGADVPQPVTGAPPGGDEAAGALDALIAFEESSPSEELGALRAIASPQQLRILDALEAAITAGADPESARREAAEVVGITPSTLRTQLQRLRKKAM